MPPPEDFRKNRQRIANIKGLIESRARDEHDVRLFRSLVGSLPDTESVVKLLERMLKEGERMGEWPWTPVTGESPNAGTRLVKQHLARVERGHQQRIFNERGTNDGPGNAPPVTPPARPDDGS